MHTENPGMPTIYHIFSTGGFIHAGTMWRWMDEVEDVAVRRDLVEDIQGIIFDSGPAPVTEERAALALGSALSGVSADALQAQAGPLQASLQAAARGALRWYLDRPSVKLREKEVYEAWYDMAPTCPQLYLYSDADPLVPPAEVERFMDIQASRGVEVSGWKWSDSGHCQHYKQHPHEYAFQISQFLNATALRDCKKVLEDCYKKRKNRTSKYPHSTSTSQAITPAGMALNMKGPAMHSKQTRGSIKASATATVAPPAATVAPVAPKPAEKYGVFRLSYDVQNEVKDLTRTWKKTIKVAVTGASGNIANHLLFMLASGEVYGKEQPIALQLLGSERSRGALEGVAMELEDSLYPLLREVSIGIDPAEIFSGADWALMVGAKPRGPGMERADLLNQNGEIFQQQGRALNESADPNCKIIVVGNPCNTNALIAMENAPRIPRRNFHALTRLDENRAKCQLALKAGKFYTSVSRVAIWGNHSTTQVPDFLNAKIGGLPAMNVIRDDKWFKDEFTPRVAQRGGALIKKWGKSSAASTAVSVADAIRSLVVPTPAGDCFSTAVCSDGNPYGVKDGLIFSFPCRSKGDGDYEICNDFILDDWLRQKLAATEDELSKERDCVSHLIGVMGGSCDIRGAEDTSVPGEM
ncbi:hypothetical protein QJQ45_022016 [Haematococcus lacustris]|nr:hypothetical protein QJQ45_022016 [Haematococcus lacustris]